MFAPDEVIFAPTSRCNLRCAHCRVSRGAPDLGIPAALAFLDSCAAAGIERVGFSGGEPFLAPDFLVAVCEAALAHGMLFDRLMTNGVWGASPLERRAVLRRVFDSGFDGRIGLSFDTWHGQGVDEVEAFIREVHAASGRLDSIELVWASSPEDARLSEDFARLAASMGGTLRREDGVPVAIEPESAPRRGAGSPAMAAADGELLSIPIQRIPYSASAEEGAWGAEAWFEDDLCAGPGNVLYVHPDGRVAVCCGFGNENPELIAGRVEEGAAALIAAARALPQVRLCYDQGLGARRLEMERRGFAFPGKTRDQCFFCDWLCKGSGSQ